MPRPEYIARLHAAKHDLRFCNSAEKPEMLRRYRAVLEEASRLAGVSAHLLEAAQVMIRESVYSHQLGELARPG